jgi:hypothetical protein
VEVVTIGTAAMLVLLIQQQMFPALNQPVKSQLYSQIKYFNIILPICMFDHYQPRNTLMSQ